MRIFFSAIGGAGIGPLAMLASQADYLVAGSDKQNSQSIEYLRKNGVNDIQIGQTAADIAEYHKNNPIDWYVYSSAVEIENPNHPELKFAKENIGRVSKRDELLNYIISEKNQKLLAVAGTHGKSTTTAMLIYLLKQLAEPLSYSVGAKIGFGDMGHFDDNSKYFALEADEFDRNFLSFSPYMAIISGIAHDHHEQYPTQADYNDAFIEFLSKSELKVMWRSDFDKLNIDQDSSILLVEDDDRLINDIDLIGLVNRRNAWLVINAVALIMDRRPQDLAGIMNEFPGLYRRMEQLAPGLYSDYAHTVEKITGAIETSLELAKKMQKRLIVIYEPLTNRRMHYTASDHRHVFDEVNELYWVPSYLAREDPEMPILTPSELIQHLSPSVITRAHASELNNELKQNIKQHLELGDLVVGLSGGGGGSLDEWLRSTFVNQ